MSDVNIIVTDREGNTQEHLLPTDMNMNLMEGLKVLEYPIEAICGGLAMCATCQCYIESNDNLPEMSIDEDAMLDEVYMIRKDNSRLTCQIPITLELDGLKLTIAPEI